MMAGAPALAAVDWGTSRFRLWLLDSEGRVLALSKGSEGLEAGRRLGFERVLRNHLGRLLAPEALPILICGMAGSHEGWLEAPYVSLPASLDQIAEAVVAVAGTDLDVRIVPGLAKRDPAAPDVMRGEETQLIGVAAGGGAGRKRVCLPGTHSKWVALEDRRVEDFTSYLTGELYALPMLWELDDVHALWDRRLTPERYGRLGGRLPKGILLVGPPGTGLMGSSRTRSMRLARSSSKARRLSETCWARSSARSWPRAGFTPTTR